MTNATRSAEEIILTLRPDGRRGVVMSTRTYDLLCGFILTSLDKGVDLTLNDVLEKAQLKFSESIENVAWCTLQVKLDLEARGWIKVVEPVYQKRLFFIKLTRQGSKKIRAERSLQD